jgi:SAM-dependent methyltransferase
MAHEGGHAGPPLRLTISYMLELFRERSYELEHLDTGEYTAAEYEGMLVELRRINRWLGDANALRHSLLRAVEGSKSQSFSVLDVGAGSGELLRVIAEWARTAGRRSQLLGLELNARSTRAIIEESAKFPTISAVRGNVFNLPFADATFSYSMCSLFTHHFKDEQVVSILRELSRVTRRRIFVIDLHRHPVAYYFYTTVGRLFLHNRLIRSDGALSILRSFKPAELLRLARLSGLEEVTIQRHFPYRLVLAASPSASKPDPLF